MLFHAKSQDCDTLQFGNICKKDLNLLRTKGRIVHTLKKEKEMVVSK